MKFRKMTGRIFLHSTGRMDLKASAFLMLLVLVIVELYGDYLYVGIFYYIITFFCAGFVGIIFYPRPFFLSGIFLSLTATLWFYYSHNFSTGRPDGGLVLGHVFSYPGYVLGIVVSAYISRIYSAGYFSTFLIAVLGTLIGFLLTQTGVCMTLMSCSWLYVN